MSYTNSRIYQLGFQLALKTEICCRKLPKWEQFALAQQLRNASRSVAANFVEGYVRQNILPSDWRRFLVYAQGSCDETTYWLNLAEQMNLLDPASIDGCLDLCEQITRMLVKLIRVSRNPSSS